MATWKVAETAFDRFDIEAFLTPVADVERQPPQEDDLYLYDNDQFGLQYVIHASKQDMSDVYNKMSFQSDGGPENQVRGTLSNISMSADDFTMLTSSRFGADVAGVLFNGNDTLTGSSHDDILRGYAGRDSLDGGKGADELYGGAGADTYVVDDANDVVAELKDEGTDAVRASVDFTLGAFVENLTLTGRYDLTATGNGIANKIRGSSGADFLFGLGGADSLDGSDGGDSLFGGAGKDRLAGGKGADHFFFNLSDTAVAKTRADTIADFHASQKDVIDLHSIDANEGRKNDQAFHFVGTDAFSHHAGELRLEKTAHDTYVMGDTDGNGRADFTIRLAGEIDVAKDAFVL